MAENQPTLREETRVFDAEFPFKEWIICLFFKLLDNIQVSLLSPRKDLCYLGLEAIIKTHHGVKDNTIKS